MAYPKASGGYKVSYSELYFILANWIFEYGVDGIVGGEKLRQEGWWRPGKFPDDMDILCDYDLITTTGGGWTLSAKAIEFFGEYTE